jgi:hypothetical protein
MNEPTNHHFIPQHFLKAWSSSNKKTFRYRHIKSSNKFEVREASIVNTGSMDNLYSVEFPDGGYQFETDLINPSIDDDGQVILREARESQVKSWGMDKQKRLASYLFYLEARHPEILETMNIKPELEVLRKKMKAEGCASHKSIDEVFNYMKSAKTLGSICFSMLVKNEERPLLARPMIPGLLKANLKEYSFSYPALITSNYPAGRRGDYLKKFLFVIAISPYKALIYSPSKDVRVFDELPETVLADLINLYTLAKADNAFHVDKSKSDFVKKHLGWAKDITSFEEKLKYANDFLITALHSK